MSPRRTSLALMLAASLATILSGCGGGGQDEPSPSTTSGPGITLGNPAPEITGVDTQGQMQSLASLKGKVVILGFSVMWCGPCQGEAPKLQSLYQELKDKGLVVLQCIHENEGGSQPTAADLQRWKDKFGLTFPVINPGRTAVKDTYKIRFYPTLYLVDKKGVLVGIDIDLEQASFRNKIQDLLKQ